MENKKAYISLNNLEVYQLARELSRLGWKIYESLEWQIKKITGDQFIESTDSAGANIAEGYGRFHFLDKIKFFYNARASLMEAVHWAELLLERNKISKKLFDEFTDTANQLGAKLNRFIQVNYASKSKK